MIMPRLGGRDRAQSLQRGHRGTKVLFITGYAG
jgi:hypothetical protein